MIDTTEITGATDATNLCGEREGWVGKTTIAINFAGALNERGRDVLLVDAYDFTIVDSPPFHGKLLDNALFAAPHIVVPALTESTSEGAIEFLFDEIAVLEEDVGITVEDVAAVANRVEVSTNEAERMLEWLLIAFDGVPVYEIRKRVALQYAFDNRVSVF